jgi:hypothetical protein
MVEASVDYNTAAIFFGDPVVRLSDGTIAGNTTGNIGGGSAGVAVIAGVFAGCHYFSASQQRTIWNKYWPGSDVNSGNIVTAYIINDPNAQFLVQAGNSTTVGVATGNIGSNVQFGYGAGSTSNGLSGAYIDVGNIATTSTLPFRINALVTQPPGANGTNGNVTNGVTQPTGSQYNYVVVGFNNVETRSILGA